MNTPEITKKKIKTILNRRFVYCYDIEYAEGRHSYSVSRRKKNDLVAIMGEAEAKDFVPDAVTIFVIIKRDGREPVLLLDYEYRYPVGRYLLSPPAGLVDSKDIQAFSRPEDVIRETTRREVFEETGLVLDEKCEIKIVSPLLFTGPGMTDESNALAAVIADIGSDDLAGRLSQEGAEGTECFDGFVPVTKKEALEILKKSKDAKGNFFSVYTWCALMYFVSGMWE
ncbi:MAG: NUDIX domain-containing protein [Clostridia bacterium]|nr:NUDIX domain-containing protein [Clostridia bacterium]